MKQKKVSNNLKGMIAFWKYDKFPYFLHGSIVKMHDNGLVELEEYGIGSIFRPILILPKSDANELICKLNQIANTRAELIKHINGLTFSNLMGFIPKVMQDTLNNKQNEK